MSLRDALAEAIHREDTPEQIADALILEFGLTAERRAVSAAPAHSFGGQPTYYNADAANNGGAIGDYIACLPVEFRIVSEWRPEENDD